MENEAEEAVERRRLMLMMILISQLIELRLRHSSSLSGVRVMCQISVYLFNLFLLTH